MTFSIALSISMIAALPGCGASDRSAPDAAGSSTADAAGSNTGNDAGSGGELPGTWETLPDVAGGPIQEIGVVELNGRIYLIGGFDSAGTVVASVQVYEIAGRTWSTAAPLPMPVHHANVAATGGKIYVLGALTGRAFTETGASWEYDPGTDTWSTLAPMVAAEARGSAAVGVIDGTIYLAGGYRQGAAVTRVSAYVPATGIWQHGLAPLPAPRDHLIGAAIGGILYAVSGRNRTLSSITGRVDAYDPAANTWSPRAAIPTARGGMGAGVIGSTIIVVGGEGNHNSTGVFREVERYDPVTDRWSALAPMRMPRHGMGAAGYGNTLYVPGGADIAGFSAVATFEALTVP